MAEHGLHRAEVCAVVQEMGGEGVAQGMRRNVAGDAGLPDVMLGPLPEHLAGKLASSGADEDGIGRLPLSSSGRLRSRYSFRRADATSPSGTARSLEPFQQQRRTALKVHILQPKSDQFAHTETCSVQDLEHRLVPDAQRRCQVRLIQQPLHLTAAQCLGQPGPAVGASMFTVGSAAVRLSVSRYLWNPVSRKGTALTKVPHALF